MHRNISKYFRNFTNHNKSIKCTNKGKQLAGRNFIYVWLVSLNLIQIQVEWRVSWIWMETITNFLPVIFMFFSDGYGRNLCLVVLLRVTNLLECDIFFSDFCLKRIKDVLRHVDWMTGLCCYTLHFRCEFSSTAVSLPFFFHSSWKPRNSRKTRNLSEETSRMNNLPTCLPND